MQLYELDSYNTDPSLRAVRSPHRTFVRAWNRDHAVQVVCNVLGLEEPGLVLVSLFKGAKPADAVVLN